MHNQTLAKRMSDYIRNAAKRNLVWNITREQFAAITSDQCVFCGSGDHVGIDRIDSSIGYEIDNCQSCCTFCNKLKSNFGEEAFLAQVARIAAFRKAA
jgi:hypothetical protein